MSSTPPLSSREVQELISAISRLSLALETYNSALTAQSAASPVISASTSAAPGDSDLWILIEDSEALPKGYRDENLLTRIVEDGPPALRTRPFCLLAVVASPISILVLIPVSRGLLLLDFGPGLQTPRIRITLLLSQLELLTHILLSFVPGVLIPKR